jgi:hypothetical protein
MCHGSGVCDLTIGFCGCPVLSESVVATPFMREPVPAFESSTHPGRSPPV